MLDNQQLSVGDKLTSPAGRLLKVMDVFVPRNNLHKSKSIPSQYRNFNRKIVIFANGSIAPLREIQAQYKIVA